MASPPQPIYMDFDRYDNFSNACYDMGNLEVSKIGDWILPDNSRDKFTYAYFHMLKNVTGEVTGGENPNSFVYGFLPHLLLMLVLTSTLSHSLHFFLSRLRQPLIVSQIAVVFLMFLPWTNGHHGDRSDHNILMLPPKRHLETTIGFIALTFKAFVYAFKTDMSMMWNIGKKPIIIGLASLVIPFMTGLIVSYMLYNNIRNFVVHKEKFVLFLAALYAHSPFIVLSDILSEFGLLSSELGRITLSASMVQTTTGLVLLGLFGIVSQGQHNCVWITIAINLFIVAFVVFAVRPYGQWIVQDTESKGYVREVHMFVITITMLLLAMLSDIAGAIFFLGPIMMGFALPNGSALGTALVDRIEVVGQELLLPIYFIVVGRNMDWAAGCQQARLWVSLALIILTICLAKFTTVAIVSCCCDMSLRKGMLLGLVMNFKGFFEILAFICLHYGQVLDSGSVTMMTFSVLGITAICAPLVSVFYKPLNSSERNNSSGGHTVHNAHGCHIELRVLSYFFDENPIPTLLDFLECLTSQEIQSLTSIYPLHLVDLNARVASSLINHRNKNGQINLKQMELVHKHFISFAQEKTEKVTVLPFTSIAPQQNIYQDICAFIIERNIDLVIVPFPRKNSSMACLSTNHSVWSLVPKVLEQARSSVGIMVYHCIQQIMLVSHSHWQYHIGVVFFGGPDDREGITIASRMACHPKVHINLLRFYTCDIMSKSQKRKTEGSSSHDAEEALDREVIDDLQRENINNNRLVVSEVTTTDVEKIIFTLQSFGDKYDLVIVGRRRGNSSLMISLALEEGMESKELGVIGDMLASSKYENPANILVVQNTSTYS